jgi:hypothetical protein
MYRNDLAHKKAAASSRCNRDDKQRAAAGNTDLGGPTRTPSLEVVIVAGGLSCRA